MKKLLLSFALLLPLFSFAQTWQATYTQADSLMRKYSFKESIPLYEQALPLAEKEYGKESENYLKTRNGLGRSITFVKTKEEIEPFLLENVELCKKYGEKTAVYAQALHNAGTFYSPSQIGNNPTKCEEFLKQALVLRKEILGEKHPDYANSMNNLAILYWNMGNYAAAEPLYKQALQIRKEALGEKHPDYAWSLNNLATLYSDMGNYAAVEPLYKQALQIKKETVGEKHPDYAGSLSNLAILYGHMGNYAAAEPLRKQALQIRKETVGEKHPDYAASMNSLAILYSNMGNYAAAEPLYKQALQIKKETVGEKHLSYAQFLSNLAVLYWNMGNYAAAEPLNKQALQIKKETVGEKHPSYAQSLGSLSAMYRNMNRFALADSLGKIAFEIVKNKQDIGLFWSYNGLGTIALATGNYAEAEENLQKGSELLEKLQGKGGFDYTYNQHDLFRLHWQTKAYGKATPLALEIKENAINLTLKNFSTLSEREREAFFDNKMRRYVQDFSSFVASTTASPLPPLQKRGEQTPSLAGVGTLTPSQQGRVGVGLIGELYNFQVFSKALLLNAAAKWKHNILASSDKRLIAKFFEWETLKNRLNALYQNDNTNLKLLDSLENQANELEKQLAKISERFNKVSDKKVRTWQEIQAKLQAGEAAIEMVRIPKFGVHKTVVDSSDTKLPKYNLHYLTDTIQYAALIITKNSTEPQMVLMPNGNEMEKQLRVYRNSIKFRIADNQSYNLLWKPMAEALKKEKIDKVYFSPDGLYHQVSMNTLYNPASKKYLADEINMHQVTNTKDLLLEKEEEITNQYAVLLGNPEFELRAPKLNGTKIEIEKIDENLKANAWETDIRQGKEAREKVIKDLFRPKVLHIATHGYFEARYEETPEEYARPKDAKQAVKSNPLWRSGLLLSKENLAGSENPQGLSEYDKNDDGILTAYEVMNLNLDGTELVVLSACETGLGEIKYGEGVYGLQRAFKVAGAKNVVMSLWKVDDAVTQELMQIFYETFAKTTKARESFLFAQAQIREKYKNPYFWGAFVLVGE